MAEKLLIDLFKEKGISFNAVLFYSTMKNGCVTVIRDIGIVIAALREAGGTSGESGETILVLSELTTKVANPRVLHSTSRSGECRQAASEGITLV